MGIGNSACVAVGSWVGGSVGKPVDVAAEVDPKVGRTIVAVVVLVGAHVWEAAICVGK